MHEPDLQGTGNGADDASARPELNDVHEPDLQGTGNGADDASARPPTATPHRPWNRTNTRPAPMLEERTYDDGVDPYSVLGVARSASVEEIRRAYVALARSTHPDVRGDDPAASEQMRQINLAWETLSDAGARAALDRRLSHRPHTGPHVADPSTDRSTRFQHAGEDDLNLGHDDFDGDDRPITEGDLPAWMRLGAPAAFVIGIFAVILGILAGGFALVRIGLMCLAFSALLFMLSPFVVLMRSRRGPVRR